MCALTLYFVRHAKAGDRSSWSGPDFQRPQSKAGWQQAHKLGKRLDSVGDWRKATVWLLHRNKHGAFTRAVVWAPPGP